MRAALEREAGNPSALHTEGRAARATIDEARGRVAALAGVSPRDVVFTSGGSESIAAAIHGVCARAPSHRRRIVVSSVEHSAVLESARQASLRGFEVVEVPCGADGRVDAALLLDAVDERAALVALQWANNETGVLQPVEVVASSCAQRGVPLLVDAVQAAGKIGVGGTEVRPDLMALSAHKIGGPQGAGALVVRDGIEMAPLVTGGAQERRRRGGTEAVASLAGFGAAAEAARSRLEAEGQRLLVQRRRIEELLKDRFPDVRIHGLSARRLPNTVLWAIPGVSGETLAIALDMAGFAVSTGSACASGAVASSHVLRAMGIAEDEARWAVRVSLGWSTTEDHVDRFLDALPRVVARIRDEIARGNG